ncbi:MAG: MBL fold metallo-hydrolase [Anaerolineaceae bacterium]|nr:MBL fold metallo-hydrolase [Anaerolineaceae bacterium]
MKVHFKGAAQTVTGSQILIEANGSKILLDCGLFQGRRSECYQCNQNFTFDPKKLDAVLLSHAHIDHSGNIPNLVKSGYRKNIYATKATTSLANIMLRDSGHIQEADVKYVNKRRKKRGELPIEPLYTIEDAEQAVELFVGLPYEQVFEPVEGIKATFHDAGHILGSASIQLDITENGNTQRLWFSGDIGREKLPLLEDPVFPSNVDYLIMESTYGDKPHRDADLAFEEFSKVVKRTIDRRGKIIIPAFAVGRTQEIIYFLNQMITNQVIPSIPVFVDSPLAINASEIFREHADLFDQETKEFIKNGKHKALNFKNLHFTRSVEESKAINHITEPCVIISASGMAETGRILHHLRNNIENPNNTIMIVGWQAPHTLGRKLAEQEKIVRIYGQIFERNAEVCTIGGLSAHAGQSMLLKYAKATQKTIKDIYLVHGEPKSAIPLMEALEKEGFSNVHYPQRNETVEL